MVDSKISYCLSCAREFHPSSPDVTLCPECGGPPEAESLESVSAGQTLLDADTPQPDGSRTLLEPHSTPPPSSQTLVEPVSARSFSEGEVPAEWLPGDTLLDTYTVSGLLGEGGMGKVYRVHHKSWNIDLAVKSPHPEFFQTPEQRDLFISEAETWVNLGLHPHIVSCYYVRSLGGIPRVFAELVEGGSLADWIAQGEITTVEQALDIAIQFAWGLAYAHQQGLVHRDVKPANVLITPDGTAKVTDFGLVKAGKGMTPEYASPEQAEAQLHLVELTPQSDLWSWGLSVLEMFAGRAFWKQANQPDYAWGQVALKALEHYLSGELDDPAIDEMPTGLVNLMRECFRADPTQRPASLVTAAERLIETYTLETGQSYPREMPKAAELRADSMNNKALTFFDLNRQEEAEKYWKMALEIEPYHLESTYNFGLLSWRKALLLDDQFVKQLERVSAVHPGNWQSQYIIGMTHLERGDLKAAAKAFQHAMKINPLESDELELALEHTRTSPGSSCIKTIQTGTINSISVAQEGKIVGTVGQMASPTLWDVIQEKPTMQLVRLAEEELPYISVSEDARYIVEGGEREIRLWDLLLMRLSMSQQDKRPWVYELESPLRSLAISSDNRFAATGTMDGAVYIFDLKKKDLVAIPHEHHGDVRYVGFSKDSKRVISGGDDGHIIISDLNNKTKLFDLSGPAVWSVAMSSDQSWLISGCRDHTIQFWDLHTQRCSHIFKGHSDEVRCLALSRQGDVALSGSADKTLRLWDIATKRCLRTFDEHTSPICAVSLIPYPKSSMKAFSADENGELKIWMISTVGSKPGPWLVCQPTNSSEALIRSDRARNKSEEIKEAMADGNFFRARSALMAAREVPGFEQDAGLLELTYLLGQRIGRRMKFIGTKPYRKINTNGGPVDQIAVTKDGKYLIADGRGLDVWHLPENRYLYNITGTAYAWYPPRPIVLTEDSQHLVAIKDGSPGNYGFGSEIGLWNLSGEKWDQILTHEERVWDFQLVPNSNELVSLQESNNKNGRVLSVWNLITGKRTTQIECECKASRFIVTSDGQYALVGRDFDGVEEPRMTMISLVEGRQISFLPGDTLMDTAAPDPNIALVSGQKGVLVVDLHRFATQHSLHECRFGDIRPSAVKFSSDGTKLFGPHSGGIGIWDVKSGELTGQLNGQDCNVFTLLTEDNGWVLSSGSGSTYPSELDQIYLWDSHSSDPIHIFRGVKMCLSIALFNHGRLLAASGQKLIQLWQLDWEYMFPEPSDWDPGAAPFLEIFLNLHWTYDQKSDNQRGNPTWTEDDFHKLLYTLGSAGYGWLRPEGVRRKLEEMARERG